MAVLKGWTLVLLATMSMVCLKLSEGCLQTQPPPCPGKPSDTEFTTLGEPCIFPFKDGSTEYFKCAELDGDRYCATSLNTDCTYKTKGICTGPDDGACSPPSKKNNTKITNGNSIIFIEDIPWQAGLVFKGSNPPQPFCGGSIIAAYWILSAAHCMDNPKLEAYHIQVLVGEEDWTTRATNYEDMQILDVDLKIPHHGYKADIEPSFDILLLRTIEKIKFSHRVKAISLPPPNYTPSENECLTASGWGVTKKVGQVFGIDPETNEIIWNIEPERHLKYIRLKGISNEVCRTYEEDPHCTEICAVGRKVLGTTCDGDSGGPLYSTEAKILVGVASGADYYCELVSTFTRVSSYLKWIDYVMNWAQANYPKP